MKKTVLAAGSFLALGVLCYVSQLWGQAQTQSNPAPAAAAAAQPAKTRIAILNLTYVISKYEKFMRFQQEIKGISEPFEKRHLELQQKLETVHKQAAELPRSATASDREKLEHDDKEIKRQMEDNNLEAKLKVGKRADDELRTLFMDIYEAAQRYAATHDFELVLHYNDALTQEDYFGAQNIKRKLNSGPLMPLYWMPSMDISMDVVKVLNSNMGAAGAPTGATPPADGTQR